MSARSLCAVALAAALAAGAGCGKTERPPEEGGRAPDFALKSLSGATVRLADLRGKVVLLDFWATYCVPCRESIPAFQRLYDKGRARGLEVVGISLDSAVEAVAPFADEVGMRYTVLLDPGHETRSSYRVRGLPTALLIGRDGTVLKRWVGFDPELKKEIEEEIEKQLKA